MRRRILAAVAVLAAGCAAVGPDYEPPPADALRVPAGWQAAGTAAVAESPADLARFWKRLDDALLDELVGEAIAQSPDLASAQARVREARARRDVASAERFPFVSGAAGARRNEGEGDGRSLFDAAVDARWEADLFGGRRRGIEAAGADLEAVEADYANARTTLAAEVALNYIEYRGLQSRLEIARASVQAQAETLQLTQWRAQAGLTSSLDVEQARSSVEQTRAQIPSLETALVEARNRLSVLTGRPPGTLDLRLAPPVAIPLPPARAAVGIPADALRRRPDLRAAERRLHAATARIGQQEAQRYPDLSLTGSIGLEAFTLGGLFNGAATAAAVAARLAATIFDAGRLRGQVRIQEAAQEQALRGYEQAVLVALEDVENAMASYAASNARREALGRAVDAANNAAILAQQRYASGLADFQSVLDTQRTLLSSRDNLTSTQAEHASAFVRLYKALGGGWAPGASGG